MKAPAAPGSSAIIGEPCETKIEGSMVFMRHWSTVLAPVYSVAMHAAFTTRVSSRTMTTLATTAPVPIPQVPRVPSAWQLGWRQLMRDFRAGELRLLVVAVTLAVGALTAVGFFADRINGGLARDARQMLGGDAIVSSDQPVPPSLAEKARALGLVTATTANFPSMGRAPDDKGGATRLVSVKAVSAAYPLRGKLRVRGAAGLAVGDTLLLGDASLKIARVIVIEPDRGTGFSSFAPRVMLNEIDLPSTGLAQPTSRIGYRFALAAPGAGDDTKVTAFTDWVDTEVKAKGLRGLRVESFATGRPEMRQTLDRAEKFLNLVALLAALLAAVAVGIASRDFAGRHLDDCAMLRVLGLPQRTIALQYVIEFALVGLLASGAGLVLGFAVHYVFVWLLSGLVDAVLPPPSAWPCTRATTGAGQASIASSMPRSAFASATFSS